MACSAGVYHRRWYRCSSCVCELLPRCTPTMISAAPGDFDVDAFESPSSRRGAAEGVAPWRSVWPSMLTLVDGAGAQAGRIAMMVIATCSVAKS